MKEIILGTKKYIEFICERCGKKHLTPASRFKLKPRKYCSRHCTAMAKRDASIVRAKIKKRIEALEERLKS